MDEAPKKKRAYTKSRLIKELAFRAGISQRQSRAALEAIIEIAYRESKSNYFILPGLCKFDVVRRAPRNVRNPITGEKLVLPERDALHVVLSKRAKDTVAPRVAPMTEAEYAAVLAKKAEEEAARKAAEEEEASPEVPAATEAPGAMEASDANESPAPAVDEKPAEEKPTEEKPTEEKPVEEKPTEEKSGGDGFIDAPEIKGDKAISFKCTTCGQEIIAPEEAVGYEAECPACGAILLVPEKSEPGTTYAPGVEGEQKTIVSAKDIEDLDPSALKNRTIRIDALFDEDDGKSATSDGNMSEAMKSRTMRIDLPDEF